MLAINSKIFAILCFFMQLLIHISNKLSRSSWIMFEREVLKG